MHREKTSDPDRDRLCAQCGGRLRIHIVPWLRICGACGLRHAAFGGGEAPPLEEDAREAGLEPLRRANFTRILDRLGSLVLAPGARVLEVGCGHGWFLDAAAARGYLTEGIEPDVAVARRADRPGRRIRAGYFPACIEEGETWDLLVMNDVFEHLPDPKGALAACHRALPPAGLLVLNLPTADGLLYRIAELMARAGTQAPLERLWQKDFPSPHLYYHDDRTLTSLVESAGFRRVSRTSLPSIQARGLWHRLKMDRRVGALGAGAQYAALLTLYPLLRWLAPSDITLHIYRRV